MKINIKSTHIELTENIKEFIKEKIGSCEKFINTKFAVEVYFEIEKTTMHHRKGKIYRAEANFVLPGKLLRAEATEKDIYIAIDQVKDKIQRELKKYKEIKKYEASKSSK